MKNTCFHFLLLLMLLAAAVAAPLCRAAGDGGEATSPEAYWRTLLPNTSIPSSFTRLLSSSSSPSTVAVNVGDGHHNQVVANVGHGGRPVVVTVPYANPFIYNYNYASGEPHVDDPNAGALFFLEKDLTQKPAPGTRRFGPRSSQTPGATRVSLAPPGAPGAGPFLPRRTASSIPFTSSRLPEILSHLSVEPGSSRASEMKRTLKECEAASSSGEGTCATSLESIADFAVESLSTRDVWAVSTTATELGPPGGGGRATRMGAGDRAVACHAEAYPYAVFYCHATRMTRVYRVSVASAAEAVAVCHADTAGWSPEHVAFKVLKVAPGTVPVCHFLPQDHVVFGSN